MDSVPNLSNDQPTDDRQRKLALFGALIPFLSLFACFALILAAPAMQPVPRTIIIALLLVFNIAGIVLGGMLVRYPKHRPRGILIITLCVGFSIILALALIGEWFVPPTNSDG